MVDQEVVMVVREEVVDIAVVREEVVEEEGSAITPRVNQRYSFLLH